MPPGIGPIDRIMPGGPGPCPQKPAQYRQTGLVAIIQMRHHFLDLFPVQKFAIYPVQTHNIIPPHHRITLTGGEKQVQMPALAEHHIIIQVL